MLKVLIIGAIIGVISTFAHAKDSLVSVKGPLQTQTQTVNATSPTTYENFRQAPAFGAPGLAASDEACMGSTSGGAGVSAGAVGVSVTFGSTWESYNCNLRMFAQQLRLAGSPKAAIMILANHPEVRKALIEAGTLPADPAPVVTAPPTGVTRSESRERHPGCTGRWVDKDGDFFKKNCT